MDPGLIDPVTAGFLRPNGKQISGAVPAHMEPTLLRSPMSSATGLGIGLYQAARLADSRGYRLALETNRDGEVCFALTGPAVL